jgi:hypothetical protein
MDPAKPFQVGVFLKYPPISSLSLWERARVRAGNLESDTNLKPFTPTAARRAAVTA